MEAQEFNRISKALAEPRRVEILELIAKDGKLHCAGIVEQMPVSQPTVSHHIKELVNANLVAASQEGQCHYLKVRRAVIEDYANELMKRFGKG